MQKFMHRHVDHSCLVSHAKALRGVVSVSGHSGDAGSWTMEGFARLLESELEHLLVVEGEDEDTADSFAASSLFNTIVFAVPDGRMGDFEEVARAHRRELAELFEAFMEENQSASDQS